MILRYLTLCLVWLLIIGIAVLYYLLHLLPLLLKDKTSIIITVIFSIDLALIVITYLKSITNTPGFTSVPPKS